ncbi:MAG TPA: hypothetical protein DCX53_01210 [Anaerolineae bacterium]|nr:hypothetical protein [Anaerolineae bacterium]
MAYSHTNSKGNTYYLHSNGRMFFFSKEIKDNALDAIPEGYNVVEMKTGMLVLKKNQPAAEAPAPMAPAPEAPSSDTSSEGGM